MEFGAQHPFSYGLGARSVGVLFVVIRLTSDYVDRLGYVCIYIYIYILLDGS